HVSNAIKCSFDMLDITEMLTREFEKEGWPEIKVGIGLNTGEMNVGDMGSEYRRAYTVLGDAVNLGSRLESLTKFYGVDLLVNETCVAHCPEMTFRPMDKVRVKGKDTAVSIFEPIRPEVATDQQVTEELEQYRQAYQGYLDQDWPTATEKFNALICKNPDRKIYSIYLERIDVLQHESLDADWDGSFTHTSK
ncbi:MAG: adenylate/guanylate cyclase domain-containing protein, partial [Algicola sp.]|nr:adenylate/guanylate cyclase domain-containing protein [Algicola sp.]